MTVELQVIQSKFLDISFKKLTRFIYKDSHFHYLFREIVKEVSCLFEVQEARAHGIEDKTQGIWAGIDGAFRIVQVPYTPYFYE